jgi:hypothetical protein
MRCHPRDGGTDLASTASDQDSDLRQTQVNKNLQIGSFVEETFVGGLHTTKFVIVFSLENFPLYSTRGHNYFIITMSYTCPHLHASLSFIAYQ